MWTFLLAGLPACLSHGLAVLSYLELEMSLALYNGLLRVRLKKAFLPGIHGSDQGGQRLGGSTQFD